MGLPCSNAYPVCCGEVDTQPVTDRPPPRVSAMLRDIEQLAGAIVGILVDLGDLRMDLEALAATEATELGRS